ncbi:TRAP-type C4-dicarboxylate transport system, small permease component [uncultured Candidatus Thioglobus sp.]|nr:TRAP-type C4-dicarboxylate transport system, small permease component [uncultured Candidatus Thioglobus sp.]
MRVSNIIDNIEAGLITLLLTAMTLITFSQVIARYVFNSGAVWALEVSTYLFAWLVLLGASYVIKVGAHIAVDSVANLFDKKNQKNIALFAVFCCMIFVIIMLIGSYEYIALLKKIDIELEDLAVLEWQAKLILPLSFALMFFRLFEVMKGILNNKITSMHFDVHTDEP